MIFSPVKSVKKVGPDLDPATHFDPFKYPQHDTLEHPCRVNALHFVSSSSPLYVEQKLVSG